LAGFNKGYDAPRDLALLGANSRDVALQGELVLLRRRRRQDLGPRPVGSKAGTESDEDGGDPGLEVSWSAARGSHHVRGPTQNHRQRGKFVVKELIELIREAMPSRRTEEVAGMKILVAVSKSRHSMKISQSATRAMST